jgi:hypothetical protein
MRSMVSRIDCAPLFALLVRAVALTLAGCGGKKQIKEQAIARYSQGLREAVATRVPDERRRAQMLLVVDQLEGLQRRFGQETADFGGRVGRTAAFTGIIGRR